MIFPGEPPIGSILKIRGPQYKYDAREKETAILEGFYMLVYAVVMIIYISGVYICICRKIYIVRH